MIFGNLTIVINDRDLVNGCVAEDHLTCVLILIVNEELGKEELIRLPNVIINDFNVKVLQDFVGFETNFAFKRHVVTVCLSCTVYCLHTEINKILFSFISCNLP